MNSDGSLPDKLHALLRMLVTIKMKAWVMHWNAKGESFYGDHLLLERVYTKLDKSIDALGERIAAANGAVKPEAMQAKMEGDCDFSGLLLLLQRAQTMSDAALAHVRRAKEVSLTGLDNYLTDLNDRLDTFIYLLSQRNRKN